MTRFTTVLGAAALALAVGAAGALAQTTPSTSAPKSATTTPAPTTAVKKAGVPKVATTEAGKKCSADADAKKLHGAERRKFRRSCVKEFKAAGAKN